MFLGPLDLPDTIPSDRREIPGLAIGYTIPSNPFGLPERTTDATGRLVWDPGVEWTGSGLASTSHDLARLGRFDDPPPRCPHRIVQTYGCSRGLRRRCPPRGEGRAW